MGDSTAHREIYDAGAPLEWARRHPSMFFDGLVTTELLAQRVLAGARLLGATDAAVAGVAGWTIVGASVDWFCRGRFAVPSNLEFASLVAFPEAGQNSTRPECLVAAFAREILVADESSISLLRGTSAGVEAVQAQMKTSAWRRALAFRGVDA